MPCYDSRSEPSYVIAEAKKEFQAELDKMTNWLCMLLTDLETLNMNVKDKELQKWWEEHKKLDKKRKDK